jgi:chaperonin GroES
VLAVGPGAVNRDGKLIPTNLKVGDKVLLPEYGGQIVNLSDKEEYVLFRDEDVLAKIEE